MMRMTLLLLLFFCVTISAEQNDSGISLIVPFKEGGGTDTWARFMSPYLSKYLPGNPEVVVKNSPGGGSTKASNEFASSALADGSTLLATSGTTQIAYILGDPRVRYVYDQWQVLLVYPTGGVVYVDASLGIKNASELDKLRGKKLVFGSQGPTSIDLVPSLAFDLLGLNVRPIFGVRGRSAGRLAFEKGLANIDFQTTAAYLSKVKPLVDSGKAVPLFSLGIINELGKHVRDPEFPELPHIGEVINQIRPKVAKSTGWESWFALYTAGFGAQKLLVLPKHTPQKVVLEYQKAIELALKDPEYLKESASVLGRYSQVTGESAERLYRLATHIPSEQIDWLRSWLRSNYNINI